MEKESLIVVGTLKEFQTIFLCQNSREFTDNQNLTSKTSMLKECCTEVET